MSALPASPSPLHRYPAFKASDFEDLAGMLETQLGAKIGTCTPSPRIDARGNRLKLPVGELWFCSYGVPLSVRFPDVDCVRVQFQLKNKGATRIRGESVSVTEKQACISEGGTEIDFGAEFQQVVWRSSRAALVQKLALIKGGPVTSDLEFQPRLDLTSAQSTALQHILRGILDAADTIPGEAGRIVLEELEQAFLVSLLAASEHPHRGAMDRIPAAAPWQVRRAESYIAAHWAQAITIDDLVAATGVSARTLFRTFKQHRACTPLEFARRVRLEKARDMIEGSMAASITEVAFACGFGDLSQFSKSFAQAFGETPSALRKRRFQSTN